jgi:hypothetical protein
MEPGRWVFFFVVAKDVVGGCLEPDELIWSYYDSGGEKVPLPVYRVGGIISFVIPKGLKTLKLIAEWKWQGYALKQDFTLPLSGAK